MDWRRDGKLHGNQQSSNYHHELSNHGNRKVHLVSSADALIAGCMIANAYGSIVTRNVEHFSRIKNVDVVGY
jgi:predicted nucleic acid-binding protein